MTNPITPLFRHLLSTLKEEEIKILLDKENESLKRLEDFSLEHPSSYSAQEVFEKSKELDILHKREIINAYEFRLKKDETIRLINENRAWEKLLKDSILTLIEDITMKLRECQNKQASYAAKKERLISLKDKIDKLDRGIYIESDVEIKNRYISKRDELMKEYLLRDADFEGFKNWVSLKNQIGIYQKLVLKLDIGKFELEELLDSISDTRIKFDILYSEGYRDLSVFLIDKIQSFFTQHQNIGWILKDWWMKYYFTLSDDEIKIAK